MKNEEPLSFLIVSNETYLKYALALVNSINRNVSGFDFQIYLYLINVEKEISIPGVILRKANRDIEGKKVRNPFGKTSEEAFCANYRAMVIRDLLSEGVKYLLYLDADSIVRKDLTLLFDSIRKSDLILLVRDGKFKIASGVIGFRNTSSAVMLVARWCSLIENRLFNWYSDQITLWAAMNTESVKAGLDVAKLSHQYIDWDFKEDSYIWVGKAERKVADKRYREEEKKYQLAREGAPWT